METLHIITPVSRIENLPRLWHSIEAGLRATPVAWWCLFDERFGPVPPRPPWSQVHYWGPGSGQTGAVGYAARNWALERITGGWLYFLDDDNLIHPEFEDAFIEARHLHPHAGWFLFDQVAADGTLLREAQCPPSVGHVDLGQAVIRRDILQGFRFQEDRYDADGELFARLAAAVPPVCIPRRASFYNALRCG